MLRVAIAGLLALATAACASPYVATPYDRASANVERIVLIDDAAETEAIAYEVASAGSNFGLIGALVDAGIQTTRRNAVNDALRGVGFDAEAALEARITSALGEHGYQVAVLPGSERAKREFLETYPQAPAGTDAYLDVVVTYYGYLSAGAFQPFRPAVEATVRLTSATDPGVVLMENLMIYNGMYPRAGAITIPPNPEYEFENREALLADPDRLAAGIEDALNEVADTAAQLLR